VVLWGKHQVDRWDIQAAEPAVVAATAAAVAVVVALAAVAAAVCSTDSMTLELVQEGHSVVEVVDVQTEMAW
jgi:hypothetical protein